MGEREIPKDFYSFETKRPFETCIECNKYLLDDETEYLIEKAVKNYEGYPAKDVVFDYAICLECADQMRKDISKESLGRIGQYFQEKLDVETRLRMMEQNPEENLRFCLIKNSDVNECREYQIYAHCKGTKLNMKNPPYMISGEVMEELLPLLSDQTIDEMNGFVSRHFSPDPSLMEPTPPQILLV